jgi:hypothetical protein
MTVTYHSVGAVVTAYDDIVAMDDRAGPYESDAGQNAKREPREIVHYKGISRSAGRR